MDRNYRSMTFSNMAEAVLTSETLFQRPTDTPLACDKHFPSQSQPRQAKHAVVNALPLSAEKKLIYIYEQRNQPYEGQSSQESTTTEVIAILRDLRFPSRIGVPGRSSQKTSYPHWTQQRISMEHSKHSNDRMFHRGNHCFVAEVEHALDGLAMGWGICPGKENIWCKYYLLRQYSSSLSAAESSTLMTTDDGTMSSSSTSNSVVLLQV
ncbi:hypothetical protein GQR58_003744 [Nymphon striatum]|nr:hypothetical protein GQR58_003744 [Nymphon striatum]